MKRTWLVTGASRGFGRALCQHILRAGDNLLATARNPDDLADLAEGSANLRVARLDVTDASEAEAAVAFGIAAFGAIDVLVNNAGYGDVGSVEDTDLDTFRRQIETNLFGTIILTKAVVPHMRARGSGHIFQFSSVGGRIGAPGRAAYSAAKWGVEGFSESLALEMALVGVRVTIVEPGGFRTDFAGSSTVLQNGNPAYDGVVGAAARRQREYDGRQPGDPVRAAKAIFDISTAADPPLRLALGSDAVTIIRDADKQRSAELVRWSELSRSTDFAA